MAAVPVLSKSPPVSLPGGVGPIRRSPIYRSPLYAAAWTQGLPGDWLGSRGDRQEEGHLAKWLKQALFTGVCECQPRARHATPKLTEMVLGDIL